jgi:osmotically-inducible protein OsmY
MKTNYQRIFMVTAIALLVASTPLQASETDDRIESSAKESYVFKTYLKNDAVKVQSEDGIVTLSGTVDQDSHKGLAQETVANLPGVKSVDNRVELKGEHPAESSNEWIAMKVNTMLLFHRNVSPSNTEVYVEEGTVTLRGEATSEAQKELITEYVKDIEGIEGVRNEMTVAKIVKEPAQTMQERIDDASITAQVKMALLTHRSTSVLKTNVETRDGMVTLGGKAANAAEKDLVTKLVNDIHGVNSVINNMVV